MEPNQHNLESKARIKQGQDDAWGTLTGTDTSAEVSSV